MTASAAKTPLPKLPAGYVRLQGYILSEEGFVWGKNMMREVVSRHPELQKEFVFIYNDFAGLGQCEVLENALLDLARIIRGMDGAKDLIRLFHKLEAITFVFDQFRDWTTIDDAAYVRVLSEIYSAAVLQVCRMLTDAKLLVSDKIFNYKEVLQRAVSTVDAVQTKENQGAGEGPMPEVELLRAYASGKSPMYDSKSYDFLAEVDSLAGGSHYVVEQYLASGGFRVTEQDLRNEFEDLKC